MHVARADLDRIGMLRDQVDVGRFHHFGDDRQADLAPDLGKQLETFGAVALESIRARARLIGTGAQDRRTGRFRRLSAGEQLVGGFDRARPGNKA